MATIDGITAVSDSPIDHMMGIYTGKQNVRLDTHSLNPFHFAHHVYHHHHHQHHQYQYQYQYQYHLFKDIYTYLYTYVYIYICIQISTYVHVTCV